MKIIVYSESFLPDLGGLERNTFTLATTLQQLKHEVVVVTGTLREPEESFPFPVVRTRKVKDIMGTFSKAGAIIINGGISMKVCLPAFFLRKKYLVIYQMSSLYYRNGNSLQVKAGNGIRKFFAEQASLNITVSNYAATQLRLKRSPVTTLINPIDNKLAQLAQMAGKGKEKRYDLLFAGRIIKGKGIFLLIDACEMLRSRNMFLVIAYAGEGDDQTALKVYAEKKNVPITFLGKLDKNELIEAYQSAKILTVPSSTHIEGSPLVIAESISLGTPVIASDQAAMKEVIGKAGLTFTSGDSSELSDKIYSVFNTSGVLDELQLHCENEKTKFSYDYYVTSVKAIIDKIRTN